jgi:hypothetical protein
MFVLRAEIGTTFEPKILTNFIMFFLAVVFDSLLFT